jgi:hypothetical protein
MDGHYVEVGVIVRTRPGMGQPDTRVTNDVQYMLGGSQRLCHLTGVGLEI